ncbi:hypothetical protein [Nostoc sp. LPT]|uniref:hypothetical protein n=1 Tax=Nostoc sp. LPT TaxID=2815387 RepID=UPI001D5854E6|nr:hypothetical protein [Nostoc sp. LPT]MBN4003170.1 hypothetical protein [Nostoc sp. LPT]
MRDFRLAVLVEWERSPTLFFLETQSFFGWVDAPVNINHESSLFKSSYTRVATIEPSLVVIECMYD